jgi:hypothetical protein
MSLSGVPVVSRRTREDAVHYITFRDLVIDNAEAIYKRSYTVGASTWSSPSGGNGHKKGKFGSLSPAAGRVDPLSQKLFSKKRCMTKPSFGLSE